MTARWKSWGNELSAKLVVMKPWSWEEIYIAGSALSLHHLLILIFGFHRTQLCTWKFEVDLRLIFRKYGGSARHCFNLAKCSAESEIFEHSLTIHFHALPDPSRLEKAQSNSPAVEDEGSLFSEVLIVVPDKDRQPMVPLASQYLTKRFYADMAHSDQEKFWSYFRLFNKLM